MAKPLISIITPSYNQGRFIRQTIESVLAQDYPAVEHIVVDGGSTDETVEILKSYPHLKWTSEPDRGQSHALNKGFRLAKGEILTWINSDDWYAPNVFGDVAAALAERHVVMGACEFTDIAGNVTEHVPNIERNWFDILKYWIYYASPAQPSIFFTRQALEEARLPNGDYIDEDLYYCMDFELWLRIAKRHPFDFRLSKTLAYFRNYDENKTGKDMAASYREDSRAFKRHALAASNSASRVSFVVPAAAVSEDLQKTVASIAHQTLRDAEVLIADYSPSAEISSALRKAAASFDRDIPQLAVRYVKAVDGGFCGAVQKGIHSAAAPLVVFLEPGAAAGESFAADASNLFEHDFLGVALPLAVLPDLISHFSIVENNQRMISLDAIFSPKTFGFHFAARKVALLELDGIKGETNPAIAIRQLFIRLLYKGWQVNVENRLSCELAPGYPRDDAEVAANAGPIAAKLIDALQREFESDPFAKVRVQHGFGFIFPEDSVKQARELLKHINS